MVWAVKSMYCSYRVPEFSSLHPTQLPTACNSRSRGYDALFWPPWALRPCEQTNHTHVQIITNEKEEGGGGERRGRKGERGERKRDTHS